jgi:hypothetical protein
MSTQLQAAQSELVGDVQRDINWFIASDEQHFVDPVTISAAAGVLLGVFFTAVLEGAKEAVKKEGKEIGQSLGKQVIDRVRALISGKSHVDSEQIKRDAEAAKAKLQGLDHNQAIVIFDQVETEMHRSFTEVMPGKRAANLATRVRKVAVKVIYVKGETI